MQSLDSYAIKYKDLPDGLHHFSQRVNNLFFEGFPDGEIHKGDVYVNITLSKREEILQLNFDLTGEVEVACDRCLENFMIPISFDGELFVKFSTEKSGYDNEDSLSTDYSDVMWINPNDEEFDYSQYLYDSICVALPGRRIHPTDEYGNSMCDPDMLARFSSEPDSDDSWDDDDDLFDEDDE